MHPYDCNDRSRNDRKSGFHDRNDRCDNMETRLKAPPRKLAQAKPFWRINYKAAEDYLPNLTVLLEWLFVCLYAPG